MFGISIEYRPSISDDVGPFLILFSSLSFFFLWWLRSVWHLPFLVRRWNLHIVATWEITMLHIIAADAFVVLGRQDKRTHERFFFFFPSPFTNVGQPKKSFFKNLIYFLGGDFLNSFVNNGPDCSALLSGSGLDRRIFSPFAVFSPWTIIYLFIFFGLWFRHEITC